MKTSANSVLSRIENKAKLLSPKQRELADHILRDYKQAAFMTATVLGASAGVSESTVIRLATTLGYSGFPEFQAALQEIIQSELTTLDRFPAIVPEDNDTLYSRVFEAEAEIINRALKGMNPRAFDQAVDLLFGASKVLIIGLQASSCLASYAGYSLGKIRPEVFTLSQWNENAYTFVQNLGKDGVAWIFAFPRYPRRTLSLAEHFDKAGVEIIGFADSPLSPLAAFADPLFTVPLRYISFIDPYAAVMCLINSLILGVAQRDRQRTCDFLGQFEEFAVQTEIFAAPNTESVPGFHEFDDLN